ncbi:MAG: hypothetical protein ACRCS3_08635 [Paracoccaceae bacterium]
MRQFLVILCLLSSPAMAQDLATGDQIKAALTGNTVIGSMVASGAYTEFYAADGKIRAADYEGVWSVRENAMCFSYGGADPTCWNVRLQGDQVTWVSGDADEGTGTILPGNPNGW